MTIITIGALIWGLRTQVKLTITEKMLRSMHERLEALEGQVDSLRRRAVAGRYSVVDDPIDGKPALEINWKGETE